MHEWYGVCIDSFKGEVFLAIEREHLGVVNRVTSIEYNHFSENKIAIITCNCWDMTKTCMYGTGLSPLVVCMYFS